MGRRLAYYSSIVADSGVNSGHTVDESVEDELAVLLYEVVDVAENATAGREGFELASLVRMLGVWNGALSPLTPNELGVIRSLKPLDSAMRKPIGGCYLLTTLCLVLWKKGDLWCEEGKGGK